ncbi:hypothetical protein [Thermoactinospora rubra]|uniref:hypothetical protein n=1 Tax=Thermoactinospora rubra TaxID=1088767 RepID=UPI00117D28EE|nr:hypothetical protein [Thermoactinospora rubra]
MVGFVATLAGAAATGAALWFDDRLPRAVVRFADGWPFHGGLALLTGLLVGLALCAVRPRSLLLPPLAFLYGGAAGALGVLAAVTLDSAQGTVYPVGGRPQPGDAAELAAVFAEVARQWVAEPPKKAWTLWTLAALAGATAFLLVLRRVLRLRARDDAAVDAVDAVDAERGASASEPAVEEDDAEYRGAFEPVVPPRPATAQPGDLFTPRQD